jgi:hypothetical protein
MAIATTTAILAGATLAAGIGGSMMGASATKKAADTASKAQQQVASQNNALAQQFYDRNTANFQPWMQSGARGNALVDSFLYGPQQAQQGGQQGAQVQGQRVGAVDGPLAGGAMGGEPMGMTSGQAPGQYASITGGSPGMGQLPDYMTPGGGIGGGLPGAQQQGGMSGYDAFVNSPYYQHPLQEGMRQLNTGYAANGLIESGAAMKGITKFGQDYGHGRMNEFIGLAERQSDRGVQGAGAIAGVGINALNSMSSNNQNAANATSNAAIARGNATSNMWGGIAGTIGSVAGGFMPSSYRGY